MISDKDNVTSFIEVNYFSSFLINFVLNIICKCHTCDITVHNLFWNNTCLTLEKYRAKLTNAGLLIHLQTICCMLNNFPKLIIIDTARENHTALKSDIHCDVISMIVCILHFAAPKMC